MHMVQPRHAQEGLFSRDPNIDPKILESSLWGPQNGTPNFGKHPFKHRSNRPQGILPPYHEARLPAFIRDVRRSVELGFRVKGLGCGV